MAGTVVVTSREQSGQIRKIELTCTADAANGSFPAVAVPQFEGHLRALRTNPGAVAPTALYDITLVDQDGVDRLQGKGADRHQTNSEDALVVYTGTSNSPTVAADDVLLLTINNNSVNSAVIVVTLVYEVLAAV